jgi:multidrug resistance efflux pump
MHEQKRRSPMNRIACFGVVLLHFAFAYVPQTAAESVSLHGIVAPAMDLTLASRAEGDIVEIAVTEGDEVARGDLLIKLDSLAAELMVRSIVPAVESLGGAETAGSIRRQHDAGRRRARHLPGHAG